MPQHEPSVPHRVTPTPPEANLLLAALPEVEYERLLPYLKPVSLSTGDILYEGDTIPRVYFLTGGLVSLMRISEDGAATEVGLVSREGMVGIRSILSGAQFDRATVQIDGNAWCMLAKELREEFKHGGTLQGQVLRHFQAILTQTSQSTLCNRLHTAEERLCRWLLTISDRVERNEFHLTQKFMENMLGGQHDGVTMTIDALQARGLISYTPGHITILDRAGMESAVCECYRVIRHEFERLFRQPK